MDTKLNAINRLNRKLAELEVQNTKQTKENFISLLTNELQQAYEDIERLKRQIR